MDKKTLLIWLNPESNVTIHLARKWAQTRAIMGPIMAIGPTFSFGIFTLQKLSVASDLVQNVLSLSIGVEVRI